MTSITRRNLLGSAGLAIASAPFVFPKGSSGQAVPPLGPIAPPMRFSNDLSKYTQNGIGSIIAAAKNGSLSKSYLQRAASCTRLFAHHIENLNIDKYFSSQVASTSYSAYLGNIDNHRRQALASGQTFDPTLQLSDIPSFDLAEARFEALRAQVSSLGLSGVQHLVADAYTTGKKHLNSSLYKPAVWDPSPHFPLIYGSPQTAHLRRVCGPPPPTEKQKKAVCNALNYGAGGTLAVTSTVLAGITAACVAELITGPAEPILCGLTVASVGLSIAIHAVGLLVLSKVMDC